MNSSDYDEVKEQIVEAAKVVFAKYGYRKSTVEDIAAAVYKGKSSIYHYFTGKEDIFRAVVEEEAKQFIQTVKDATDRETSPVLKLRTLLITSFYKVKEKTNFFNLLKDEWFNIFDFTVKVRFAHESKLTDIIESIFREGNESGVFDIDKPKEKAMALLIALYGFISPWTGVEERIMVDGIEHFLDMVLSGILKKGISVKSECN